jgi:DNA polymerase III delta prime subunit
LNEQLKELWVEKYRPKTAADYVFRDENQKAQVDQWIKNKSIPHLLLSGSPGIGKTTLAKMLLNEMEINEFDILTANGSKEGRKIEWVDKLINFCQIVPFGPFKVVLIDEADYLNKESVQPALRNLMEDYSSHVRFIMTCNYPNKIIPALHSRCQGFHIETVDRDEFTARVATILVNEKIDLDLDTLDTYVKATYPDMRKCINLVQMNSGTGTLLSPDKSDKSEADWRLAMVQLFKQGKISDARKLVCKNARSDEMEEIYRWLYDNLDLISKDEIIQDKIVLAIKQGLVDHNSVADTEINLAATLIRIAHLV